MLISKKLSKPTLLCIGLCLIFPFLVYLRLPLFDGYLVKTMENMQALLLLGTAIFTYFFIRPLKYSGGKKQFWLWVICWWVLLFGRSISWGRDYFPEISHDFFRMISILCIAPVILMLCSKDLRLEILQKLKTTQLPILSFILAFIALIVADSIEHSRLLSPIFLHQPDYKDFMEELYEFPLIWGLFEFSYLFMKQELPSTLAK